MALTLRTPRSGKRGFRTVFLAGAVMEVHPRNPNPNPNANPNPRVNFRDSAFLADECLMSRHYARINVHTH